MQQAGSGRDLMRHIILTGESVETTSLNTTSNGKRVCTHEGMPCSNARYCSRSECKPVPLREGFIVGGYLYYCNDHDPGIDEVDDENYWTQWEVDDDCDECPVSCTCKAEVARLTIAALGCSCENCKRLAERLLPHTSVDKCGYSDCKVC